MIGVILLSTSVAAVLALSGAALLVLFPLLPSDLGGAPNLDRKARRVRITVDDDDWIDAWYLEGTRNAIALIFHGYGRNHSRAWRYGAFLNRAGYHALTVDFRSSRYVDRKPTTLGHFELEDAQAALDWVRTQPGLKGHRIGILGESLGGSTALRLASANPDVVAVIADCAFATGRQAIEDSCQRWARLPKWPSADILCSLGRALTGFDPSSVDVLAAAERLRDRPVLFIHGLEDNRFSPEQARQLWRAAGSKDPLWLMPRVGHNEGWIKNRTLYEERVSAFFAHHLLAEGSGLSVGPL